MRLIDRIRRDLEESHTRRIKEKAIYDATYKTTYEKVRQQKAVDEAVAKAYKNAYAPTFQQRLGKIVADTASQAADNYKKRAQELARDERESRKREEGRYWDF
jgi:isoaspartyl peptidase/L-asparaginase-like protein (Ntn-hydrolase superfamily)